MYGEEEFMNISLTDPKTANYDVGLVVYVQKMYGRLKQYGYDLLRQYHDDAIFQGHGDIQQKFIDAFSELETNINSSYNERCCPDVTTQTEYNNQVKAVDALEQQLKKEVYDMVLQRALEAVKELYHALVKQVLMERVMAMKQTTDDAYKKIGGDLSNPVFNFLAFKTEYPNYVEDVYNRLMEVKDVEFNNLVTLTAKANKMFDDLNNRFQTRLNSVINVIKTKWEQESAATRAEEQRKATKAARRARAAREAKTRSAKQAAEETRNAADWVQKQAQKASDKADAHNQWPKDIKVYRLNIEKRITIVEREIRDRKDAIAREGGACLAKEQKWDDIYNNCRRKKQMRRMMMKIHPDKNAGCDKYATKVTQVCNNILNDPNLDLAAARAVVENRDDSKTATLKQELAAWEKLLERLKNQYILAGKPNAIVRDIPRNPGDLADGDPVAFKDRLRRERDRIKREDRERKRREKWEQDQAKGYADREARRRRRQQEYRQWRNKQDEELRKMRREEDRREQARREQERRRREAAEVELRRRRLEQERAEAKAKAAREEAEERAQKANRNAIRYFFVRLWNWWWVKDEVEEEKKEDDYIPPGSKAPPISKTYKKENDAFKVIPSNSASPTLILKGYVEGSGDVVIKLWSMKYPRKDAINGLMYERKVYERTSQILAANPNAPFVKAVRTFDVWNYSDIAKYLRLESFSKQRLGAGIQTYLLQNNIDGRFTDERFNGIVTEYAGSDTLYDMIRNGNLSNTQLMACVKQAIYGIYLLYKNRIVHNDLHLGNIFVKDGRLYMYDHDRSYIDGIWNGMLSADRCDVSKPCHYSQCNLYHTDPAGYSTDFFKFMGEITMTPGIADATLRHIFDMLKVPRSVQNEAMRLFREGNRFFSGAEGIRVCSWLQNPNDWRMRYLYQAFGGIDQIWARINGTQFGAAAFGFTDMDDVGYRFMDRKDMFVVI